ncbi:MAG: glycosyltransferase [Thaumarchaeota archaeon]|nr:glycosyltransferase [Nitrososphaerota archaeon]
MKAGNGTALPENPFLLILTVLLPFIALAWTLVAVRLIRLRRSSPKIPVAEDRLDASSPLVSVVIPARNEEKNLARTLESVTAQDYPNIEVIVVDDASTDSTLSIARSYASRDKRIRVLEVDTHPEGWIGKTWACQQGAKEARGEWLLFTDADTNHAKHTLSSSYLYAKSLGADIFSLIPAIELKGVVAKSAAPILGSVIILLYPVRDVNNPRSSQAYTFGAYVLVKKEPYFRIGGHESVKDEIVEDRALGQKAKQMGLNLKVARGEHLVSSKWGEGAPNVWHGFERVFSSSITGHPLYGIGFAALAFCMWLLPFISLLTSLYAAVSGAYPQEPSLYAAMALSLYASSAFLTVQAVITRGGYWGGASRILLAPMGAAIFIGALLTTVYKTWRGKPLTWRGRKYTQRSAK